MTRPLRLEFPGALYHVTSRGDRRRAIFFNDEDRTEWLKILSLVCSRFNIRVHAYCQMGNHYHFLPETVDGNLAGAMRQLNGIYSQYFNRRYGLTGHVLQGRYKAILVQKESYLLELSRYIVLNPVRSGQFATAADWQWSSYGGTTGDSECPEFLRTEWLLSQFSNSRETAIDAYRQFVSEGIGMESPLLDVKHQFVLGDAAFAKQHGERFDATDLAFVAKNQRRVFALSLQDYEKTSSSREEAMARAYFSTAYTMLEIGKYFRVSAQTVSRAVRLKRGAAAV